MHDGLFEAALGIAPPWFVAGVRFDEASKVLTIGIDFKPGTRFSVEGASGEHAVHDTLTKTYRHLNFFQHECVLEVRTPRVKLPEGTVRLVKPPFADLLCGKSNERCVRNDDGSLALDSQNRVQFDDKKVGMSLLDFLEKTPEGKKMAGLTGGVQGAVGTLFGFPYRAGSWQDKLVESFAGTHDEIGGNASGLYDAQGNATRNRDSVTERLQNAWSASGAILLSSPFAASEGMTVEVWKALGLLLKAAK